MKSLLPVKPFRQSEAMCGPACLKMVMDYFGVKKTESEWRDLTGANFKHGTKGEDIIRAAKRCGFKAFIKDRAQIGDINIYFKKKIPVIVDWFSTDDGHYSVVVGVNKKNVYLQDPETGALRTLPIEVFRRVWFDFRGSYLRSPKNLHLRRMLVIHP